MNVERKAQMSTSPVHGSVQMFPSCWAKIRLISSMLIAVCCQIYAKNQTL